MAKAGAAFTVYRKQRSKNPMRARFAIVVLLVVMLVLAMLMSPVAGQTAIPLEATTEAEPPFPIVLSRPDYCVLSPDDTAVAVMNDGVYNVADGSLRFALPVVSEDPSSSSVITVSFTDSGNFVRVGDLMFDAVTGEPVDRTLDYSIVTSNERWRVVDQEIFDVHTGKQVGALPQLDDLPTPIDIEFAGNSDIIIITGGSQEEYAILVEVPTGDILAEIESRPFSISYDGTRYAIAGDGIYDIASRQRIAPLPEGNYWLHFSPFNPEWIAFPESDGVVIYDTSDGSVVDRLAPRPGSNEWQIQWGEDSIFISGDKVTHHANGSVSRLGLPGRLYELPSGELLLDGPQAMAYIGGARRAWQGLIGSLDVIDPFNVEVLASGGVVTQIIGNRAVVSGLGEFDIDTWELLFAYPEGLLGIVENDEAYRYIVAWQGLYDARTAEHLLETDDPLDLTRDGRALVASRYGESCTVYRLPDAQE
jgi:hypothetical protein